MTLFFTALEKYLLVYGRLDIIDPRKKKYCIIIFPLFPEIFLLFLSKRLKSFLTSLTHSKMQKVFGTMKLNE